MMLVSLENNEIVIRLSLDNLAVATELCPATTITDEFGTTQYLKVNDKRKWAEAIVRALKNEEEDGTTLLHLAFDRAMFNACEAGEEGFDVVEGEL